MSGSAGDNLEVESKPCKPKPYVGGREICILDSTLVDVVENATGPNGYKCKVCNVFYPKKWHMKLHIRIHTGEKPYICDFENCDKAFPRPGSLSEHKRKIHENLVHHVCPVCDKDFYARNDMLRHIVTHDEARIMERYLPPQMMHLLAECDQFNFDGELIASDCVCAICSKIFKQKSLLQRHFRQVHSKEHKCVFIGCGKSFSTRESLENHAKKHHDDKPKKLKQEKEKSIEIIKSENGDIFQCNVSDCTKKFDSKYGLEKHVERMDHEGDFFFSCLKCPKKYASSLGLKIHNRDSCDIVEGREDILVKKEETVDESDGNDEIKLKDFPFSCDLCEKFLSSMESLNIHKLIHKELGRFACQEEGCSEVFPNNKSLQLHLKGFHKIEKTIENRMFHICDECGKQCTSKAVLQGHMLRHTKDKNYMCMECGKKLKRRASLILHMKLHTGEKNFHCHQCGASYVSSPALRNHILSMHTDTSNEVPFLCTYCGDSFKKKHYLLKHITVHTGEKKFECTICPKKFRLEISLENHTNMHNGVKPFQCPQCDKKFTQRQQRTMHVRRHNGDKRHKCNKCGLTFIEPAGLRHHMQRNHREQ